MSSDPKKRLRQVLHDIPIDRELKAVAERGIDKMSDEQAAEMSRKLDAVLKDMSDLFSFKQSKSNQGGNR